MGWWPAELKSWIARRAAHRPMAPLPAGSTSSPESSGPRWRIAPTMSLSRLRISPAGTGPAIPPMPHISRPLYMRFLASATLFSAADGRCVSGPELATGGRPGLRPPALRSLRAGLQGGGPDPLGGRRRGQAGPRADVPDRDARQGPRRHRAVHDGADRPLDRGRKLARP